MEKSNKKQEILQAALDLFSVYGYEATSISQIADAVGIKKASLYFHFESKQAILDTLRESIETTYNQHSLFAKADFDNPGFVKAVFGDLSPEAIANQVKGQLLYVLHDEDVSKVRKLMIVEQFRNPEFAAMQKQRNYEDIFAYNKKLIGYLVKVGVLKDYDIDIMAAQFAFPNNVWLSVLDREPEREEEIMDLVDRHVKQFMEIYKK